MREVNNIVDLFVERQGLFENVFGKASDKIVFDDNVEHAKRLLKEVFKKTDVDDLFPPVFDEEKAGRVMGTMFRFADANRNGIPDVMEQNKGIK